jgi:hypothetical protein
MGRERLLKAGVRVDRPSDFFAEMVKSEEHMAKVKLSSRIVPAIFGRKELTGRFVLFDIYESIDSDKTYGGAERDQEGRGDCKDP